MAKSFAALIDDWTKKTEERIDAVYARSVELLGAQMSQTIPEGGLVPIDTGNLANSLLADKSSMPSQAEGPFTGSNVGLVAATLKASEFVYIGYQAKYAARMNFGFVGADKLGRVYNQEGHHFVETAVAEWPNLVTQAITEVRGGR